MLFSSCTCWCSCRLCGHVFCNSCAPKISLAPYAAGFAAVADGFALLPRATLPRLGEGLLANALSGGPGSFVSRLIQGSSGSDGAVWHGEGAAKQRAAQRAEFVDRLRATTARVCAQCHQRLKVRDASATRALSLECDAEDPGHWPRAVRELGDEVCAAQRAVAR